MAGPKRARANQIGATLNAGVRTTVHSTAATAILSTGNYVWVAIQNVGAQPFALLAASSHGSTRGMVLSTGVTTAGSRLILENVIFQNQLYARATGSTDGTVLVQTAT